MTLIEQKYWEFKLLLDAIALEHAIGGMKVFHCLMHRIRNHLDSIIDSLFWIPAGLWNLKIS